MRSLGEYLDLGPADARAQWRQVLGRRIPAPGTRQEAFTPLETLLCLGVAYVVEHRHYGGSTAHRAPTPVPELARLFRRPPSSVLAKMANLDGSRRNGARQDLVAGTRLRDDPGRYAELYRTMLAAARAEGLDAQALPDFLHLEAGGHLRLLGQEELGPGVIEAGLAAELEAWRRDGSDLTEEETERMLVAKARVGQHRFAAAVLGNCGHRCVFCGLGIADAPRMLVASHIKPWRDSTGRERLDHHNGLAACPTHDVAFDTGLLTVDDSLRVRLADGLAEQVEVDVVAAAYFRVPPLREHLLLPDAAEPPHAGYLAWHRRHVFAA